MGDQRFGSETTEQKARSPMWDLLKEENAYRRPKRGDILEAEVVRIDPDAIIVDIGSKTEGFLPSSELDKLDPATRAEIALGAKISVYVVRPESPDGDVIVSLDMARSAQEWQEAQRYQEQGLLYEGTVAGYNKGGLIVPFGGVRGFLPSSQLSNPGGRSNPEERERYLASRVGQSLSLKVIEVDRQRRRLIFSERAAAKEAREARKELLLAELQEGQIRRGRVSSLSDFGAFVDLGGADGLIHISELSWQRVQHPREVLQVGQEIEVYILRVDRERKRIGLSLRKLRPDPWREVQDKFRVGQIVEGTITHVVDFGAFARIAEGIEGLIHVSELGETVRDPHAVVKEEETWPLKIISIDAQRQRIGLSLKQAPSREEVEGLAVYQEMREELAPLEAESSVPPAPQPETEMPIALEGLTESAPPAKQPQSIRASEAFPTTAGISEEEPLEAPADGQEPLALEASVPELIEEEPPETVEEHAEGEEVAQAPKAPKSPAAKRATRSQTKKGAPRARKTTSRKTGPQKSARKKSKL